MEIDAERARARARVRGSSIAGGVAGPMRMFPGCNYAGRIQAASNASCLTAYVTQCSPSDR